MMNGLNIAANAEKLSQNDVKPGPGAVKFISRFHTEFRFRIMDLDENGKQKYHTDANGNNRLPDYKEFKFVKVDPHKGPDGKIDPNTAFQFFIADPTVHGKYFKQIIDKLSGYLNNPLYKMFTDEGFFKNRNPEAYRIAKEKEEMVGKYQTLENENEELRKKLGLRKA